MRRHARRMRRDGLQPMVVINSGDRLPDLAVVLLIRGIWRYRSEIAPLMLVVVTAIAGAILHLTHPEWWPYLLIATVLAMAQPLVFGDRVGLARLIERAYAAAVITCVGSWLTAATALSPSQRPLPHLILIAGTVLAIPWWAHRRRRARVQVERKLAAWPEISEAVGLTGSRIQSAIVDVWGWRARLGLARGQTIQDVISKIPALESALGTFRGAVRISPTPDDKANRFELRVLEIDPHAGAIPWPGPSVSSISDPIELGPFEDATSARVMFLRRHGLIGGIAGSGKSGGINVLMGNLVACSDVVIWAIDLKRGMELQPWAPCIDRLATTPSQASALLQDAVTILEARAAWMADHGLRVWEPTPDMPALVVVTDEYAELADDAPDALEHSDSIARRGRAVAVTQIVATQRPTQKAMGNSAVRSQMDIRISFRVRERRDVNLILGEGMYQAGWHAHALDAPGKFLISAPEHDIPRRARAYLLTDETVRATVEAHTDGRTVLDGISREALRGAAHNSAEASAPGDSAAVVTEAGKRAHGDAESVLRGMLATAPPEGVPVALLMTATGLSRPTLYRRLDQLIRAGDAVQVTRGRYRAADPLDGNAV
jgi:DNA translocase FtsK/SpoIIIE-like protein